MSDKTPTPPQREAMMIATALRELAMYVDLSVFKEEAFEIAIDMLAEDGFGKSDKLRKTLYMGLLTAMEDALDGEGRMAVTGGVIVDDDDSPFGGATPPAMLRVVKDDES